MKSKVLCVFRNALLISSTLLSLSTSAQQGILYDANMQLSSSFVNQVYLDNDGYIWVSTRNGLNKYDGYQFRTFKKEVSADMGMASNYVNWIMQDSKGVFYVGMYGALQSFNGYRFQDIQVYDLQGHIMPPYVTSILQRHNGDIVVGTSGHGLLQITDSKNAHQIGGAVADVIGIHEMTEDRPTGWTSPSTRASGASILPAAPWRASSSSTTSTS